MSYNRLPKRNKTVKTADVFITKNGVQYKVLNIAGVKVEVPATVFNLK